MNWKNLKNYCCPRCGASLKKDKAHKKRICSNVNCEFLISEKRLIEIKISLVDDEYKKIGKPTQEYYS